MPENKDILNGQINHFGNYDIAIVNGKLQLTIILSPADLINLLTSKMSPAIQAAAKEGETLLGIG